jgi:hypothetical protein
VTEPVAKPKPPKRRRRSARVYVNLADLPADELERRLAIVSTYFPSDATEVSDDEPPTSKAKAKALAKSKEAAVADAQKAVADLAAGEYGNLPDRVSEPIQAGHAAYGVGDHGAAAGARDPMSQPGPRQLAYQHPDMRQSSTNVLPLFTMATDANQFPRDLNGMSSGISVALSRLDAAGATNLASAPGNPISRPGNRVAPTGAQPANGGHSLSQPEAVHPASMKASDRREIMKRAMFGDGGRG